MWQKIYSQTETGAYVWTAPDLYGDGDPYDVGVLIIGGGGSGASSSGYNGVQEASGGASGHSKSAIITVTPGQEYNLIVGSGGAAVTSTYRNGSNQNYPGFLGGNSSAFGLTAGGGHGGLYDGNVSVPAAGGQSSDSERALIYINSSYRGPVSTTPAGRNNYWYSVWNNIVYSNQSYPGEFVNPFEGNTVILAAGGASGTVTQTTINVGSYKTSGGYYITGPSGTYYSATKGTLPGCGGGGCTVIVTEQNSTVASVSAAGCAGAVYIYAPKSLN